MAHTISSRVVHKGSRVVIAEYTAICDGSTGELAASKAFDASDLGCTSMSLNRYVANLNGTTARLAWDADTDIAILAIPEGASGVDFTTIGGAIHNDAGTGVTGDVMITTVGFTTAGDMVYIRAEFLKES